MGEDLNNILLLTVFINLYRLSTEGHITAETMMDILRDKDSGINMEGMFTTTGSMVSVIPKSPCLPGVHYFTGTPHPERYSDITIPKLTSIAAVDDLRGRRLCARSVFKPFIFVENLKALKETSSPSYGPDDPVKKKPRFQSKPDRRHELFVKHELVAAIMETHEV